MTQTLVPSRRSRFLYKAKGKARAESPSPPLPSSPSPVFVSQTGAAASSSRASNCLSAARKRSRTPESASDDDDDDTSEPPTKRQKKNKPRPLRREGAFHEYSAPLPVPAQAEDIHQDDDKVHVNLIKSFLDQVQDLDIPGWLSRGSGITPPNCDPFAGRNLADDDVFSERHSSWMPRAELQGARGRRRGARADDDGPKALYGAESDDDARRRPAFGCTSPCAVSRT